MHEEGVATEPQMLADSARWLINHDRRGRTARTDHFARAPLVAGSTSNSQLFELPSDGIGHGAQWSEKDEPSLIYFHCLGRSQYLRRLPKRRFSAPRSESLAVHLTRYHPWGYQRKEWCELDPGGQEKNPHHQSNPHPASTLRQTGAKEHRSDLLGAELEELLCIAGNCDVGANCEVSVIERMSCFAGHLSL